MESRDRKYASIVHQLFLTSYRSGILNHTYLGGGRDVFMTGISSSESSMVICRWLKMINGCHSL